MESKGTSWKVLGVLVIVVVVIVVVISMKKGDTDVTVDPIDVATSTIDNKDLKNLNIACAAPAKNQILATGSSSKRMMWAATPSIDGKVVEDAQIEWSFVTPEEKIVQVGKDISYVLEVNRSDFAKDETKKTFTLNAKVTIPSGQFLVGTCAPVDVTLQ